MDGLSGENMKQTELETFIAAGTKALGLGEPLKALVQFERAAEIEATPVVRSSLAYCLARERGQVKTGRGICEKLIESDPGNCFHHLNLGRILVLEGDRGGAIAAFRAGISLSPHPQIIAELKKLGLRRSSVIGFLPRDNPLNKYLGLLRDLIVGEQVAGRNDRED
jgi:Flp pilus assembly protein TadD